jgi:hypothetical protein
MNNKDKMRKNEALLSHDYVLSLFTYDGELLRWRKSKGAAKKGSIAGYINSRGYRHIMINKTPYYGHRLAFFYVKAYWPTDGIDHKNGVKSSCKIENLREATTAENGKNCCISKNNTSGITGVCWDKRYKKWHARIQVDMKPIHLGYFDTFEEAVAARKDANRKYEFSEAHGLSAKAREVIYV